MWNIKKRILEMTATEEMIEEVPSSGSGGGDIVVDSSSATTVPVSTAQGTPQERKSLTPKLFAPLAFSLVTSGIYRSAYPNERTYAFLAPYQFRTFISLAPAEIRPELRHYCHQQGIALLEYDVKFNQEPFLTMDASAVQQAIRTALQAGGSAQSPVLIFCVNGKVRTGGVVACLRKHLHWSMVSIIEEFEHFADPEGQLSDLMFIDRYEVIPSSTESGPV